MSDLDKQAFEASFNLWKQERVPEFSNDKAFERFAIEQTLKDADLTDEEIESGVIAGADDGGIDGLYFFVNRLLIQDETEVPDPAITAQLMVIQTKNTNGFSETAIEKINNFIRDLLDYAKEPDSFTYLNTLARDAISRFRTKYNSILASPHTFKISFHYLTKSDDSPNEKVLKKVENLKAFVKQQLSLANIEFEFWGCTRLLAAARTPPNTQLSIDFIKNFTTDDDCAVCLVKLKSFAAFLTDERGTLRTSILEPNVRDYQGKSNPVNKDIRQTLGSVGKEEFWWLNNGITILATRCSITGNKLTVEKPEIVNGLQTSHEIFSHFQASEGDDNRAVLIRIIVPPDEQTRNKITKATNFQTQVNPVSLRATDQIHFDIEDRLKLYGLFYDRRKGQYRNLKKPISKIISIRTLARAVIAIVLQQPDQARGRPQQLLNDDDTYKKIFNDGYDRNLYVSSILIDRQVDAYLFNRTDLLSDVKRDIGYYIDTWLVSELTKNPAPSPQQIASISQMCNAGIPIEKIDSACSNVLKIYEELGGTSKVAKSQDFRTKVLEAIEVEYPPLAKTGS